MTKRKRIVAVGQNEKPKPDTVFLALREAIDAIGSEEITGARWHRALAWGTPIAATLMIGSLMIAWRYPSPYWHWGTMFWGALTMLQGLVVGGLFIIVVSLADPTATMLKHLDQTFRSETNQSAKLAARFAQDQLDHANERLTLAVTQLRHRIGVLVGAVEKVGIVPAALAALFLRNRCSRKE